MIAESPSAWTLTRAQRHAKARAALQGMGDAQETRERLRALVESGFHHEQQLRLADGHADLLADFRDAITEIARLRDWAERLRLSAEGGPDDPSPQLAAALTVAELIEHGTAALFGPNGAALSGMLEQANGLALQIEQDRANREGLDPGCGEQRALEVAALSIVAHHDFPASEPVNGFAPLPGVVEPIDWIVVDGCGTDSKALQDALVAAHGDSLGRDLFNHLLAAREQSERLAEHRAGALSLPPERGGRGEWNEQAAMEALGYPRVMGLDEAVAVLAPPVVDRDGDAGNASKKGSAGETQKGRWFDEATDGRLSSGVLAKARTDHRGLQADRPNSRGEWYYSVEHVMQIWPEHRCAIERKIQEDSRTEQNTREISP